MKERYQSKVVVFLILTREVNGIKQILLQERCNTGYMDGQYDMAVSGHLEKGESMAMTVIREAREEIGIEIDEKDLRMVCLIHPYEQDYINVFFEVQKYKGIPEIKEKDKCDNLQWFDIDKLPANTITRNKNVIENIKLGIMYDDDNFTHQKMQKEILSSKCTNQER